MVLKYFEVFQTLKHWSPLRLQMRSVGDDFGFQRFVLETGVLLSKSYAVRIVSR